MERTTASIARHRLIVFDFDGTLADSFPFFMQVFNNLADTHGFRRVSDAEREALRGLDARGVMRHVGLPLWKFPRVAQDFRARMAAQQEAVPLFQGVPTILQALSTHGYQLAILSSNSETNVRAILGTHAQHLHHYRCGVSLLGKARRLRGLARQLGVAPSATLYVGDELRDAEAAQQAGIDFAAVAWGYTRFDSLLAKRPAFAFAHIDDILSLTTAELPTPADGLA